jgi:hypothetical protein
MAATFKELVVSANTGWDDAKATRTMNDTRAFKGIFVNRARGQAGNSTCVMIRESIFVRMRTLQKPQNAAFAFNLQSSAEFNAVKKKLSDVDLAITGGGEGSGLFLHRQRVI